MLLNLAHTTLGLIFGGGFGWGEALLLGLLGVLVFGKRLPEVGKSIGKGIVEFKKGLSGIEDDIESAGKKDPPKIEKHEPPSVDTSDDTEKTESTNKDD